jgi:hypothetical protein
VIAKFDGTVNEVEGLNSRSFHPFMWYPKDNKAGVQYEKERGTSLGDFIKFVNE